MSVTFTWDDPSRTQLRFIFDAMWQTEDLTHTIHLAKQFIEEQDVVVDVIIDMTLCESMPSNLSRLRDHLKLLDNQRVGVMVFITQNNYVQKVMQLLNQLLRQYFTMYFTDSLEDAHRIIQRATITRESRL